MSRKDSSIVKNVYETMLRESPHPYVDGLGRSERASERGGRGDPTARGRGTR